MKGPKISSSSLRRSKRAISTAPGERKNPSRSSGDASSSSRPWAASRAWARSTASRASAVTSGPMNAGTPSSAAAITSVEASFSTMGMKRSATESATIRRRVQVQRCPVVAKAARTHSIAARRRSAFAVTTAGFDPPISSATRRPGVSRFASRMRRPTGNEPVNSTPSTSGCVASRDATAPPPCTTLKTPAGNPASCASSAISCPTDAPFSLGLKTTVFPSKSAGTMWPFGRCAGKLNGPSTVITPCGLKVQMPVLPAPAATSKPATRASTRSSSVMVTFSATIFASSSASHFTLPTSREIAAESRAACAMQVSRQRSRCARRASGESAAQAGSARRAAATASSACEGTGEPVHTTPLGRAGSRVAIASPESGRNAPSM